MKAIHEQRISGLVSLGVWTLLLFASPAAAVTINSHESHIEEVTVYRAGNQAMVTRRSTVDVDRDTDGIEFQGLPLGVSDDSIRVSGSGTARAVILGTDLSLLHAQEALDEGVRELEENIRKVKDEAKVFEDKVKVAGELIGFLQHIAQAPRTGGENGEPNVDKAAEIYDLMFQKLPGLREEIRAAEIRLREKRELLDKLKRQLNALKGKGDRSNKAVLVRIEVQKAGKLTLDLRYTLPGANWVPVYDARFDSNSKQLKLVARAIMSQTTGEDWNGVDLTLSTSRPSVSAGLAELDPLYVSFFEPQRRKRGMRQGITGESYEVVMPAPMAEEPGLEDFAEAEAKLEKPFAPEDAAVAQAEAYITGFSATFRVPGKVGVPSSGEPRGVAVAEFMMKPEIRHHAIPRVATDVYIRADMKNETGVPLLAGTIHVFRDGDFIGKSSIEDVAPGDELELHLGTDDRVTMEVEPITRKEGNAGIFGNKEVQAFGRRYVLKNHGSDDVSLVLEDRVPYGTHEQISVEITQQKPKAVKIDELNRLTWELDIPKGGETEVLLGYKLTFPKDRRITPIDD